MRTTSPFDRCRRSLDAGRVPSRCSTRGIGFLFATFWRKCQRFVARLGPVGWSQSVWCVGAVVSPFLAKHYRDISDMTERCSFGKYPESLSSRSMNQPRNPRLFVQITRQMSDQVLQALIIALFPRSGNTEDKTPLAVFVLFSFTAESIACALGKRRHNFPQR